MKNADIILEKNPSKGIIICLFAYVFVSLMGASEKFISPSIPVPVILFFQNLICLLLITPELMRKGVATLRTDQWRVYIIRIASGLGCYSTLFYLIRFIPISEALLFQYSASLWMPFILFIWTGVRMPNNLWYSIIIGFLGIALILKPSASMVGVVSLIGILCGILQGISMVGIRKLSVREPLLRMFFYYFLINTLVLTPWIIKDWSPLHFKDVIFLIAVGVTTYIAQKLITISLQYAQATTLAPICYASILFSGLFGWIFWHEVPEETALFGMLLVICGCFLSFFASRRNVRLQSFPEKSS